MPGAAVDAPEGEDVVGADCFPTHAGTLHALLDDVVDGALDRAATDEEALGSKGAVPHSTSMCGEVAMQAVDRLSLGFRARRLALETQALRRSRGSKDNSTCRGKSTGSSGATPLGRLRADST